MPQAAAAKPSSIQCFKPGRFVPLKGGVLEFSQSHLAATAAAYDPALHEAPLVVGHPQTDSPAFGYVGALAYEGGALEATPHQVNPEFAALVKAGTYKKVSAAFWAPDAPGNPKPGVYYLRHIGFLGGAAPGVPGLRPVAFAGSDAGLVEFSAPWSEVDNASLWRNLRDWFLAKFGADDADKAVPAYLVGSVEQAAQAEVAESQATLATSTAAFAAAPITAPETSVTPAEKAALEAENATLRQQLLDQAAQSRKTRLDACHGDAVAFAAALVTEGRLPDGRRDVVVALFDAIAEAGETAGAVVQFGQGDAAKPLLPEVKAMLASLPRIAPLGRLATKATAGADVDPKLLGNQAERRAAIAAMFPDLPSAGGAAA